MENINIVKSCFH